MFVSRTIINLVSIISLLVLVACGGGGGGDGGDGGGDTNPDLTAPSALVAVAVSDTAIDLSWSDNSGNEINFVVQRSTTSGSGFTTIATLGADVTTYSDTGLIPSTTYYYRVYATNDSGNSSTSNEANAATNNPPTANFPFSVGKQWTYNFNRSVTTVDSYSGVVNKVFAGQAVLYVEDKHRGKAVKPGESFDMNSNPLPRAVMHLMSKLNTCIRTPLAWRNGIAVVRFGNALSRHRKVRSVTIR